MWKLGSVVDGQKLTGDVTLTELGEEHEADNAH